MSRINAFLTALTAISLCAGCDDGRPPLYPVHGTVRFATGDPVRNAAIELVPDSASPSPRGRIDSEGSFRLGTYAADDGAPAGEYRVVVVQPVPPSAPAALAKLGAEHDAHRSAVRVVSLKHAAPDTTEVRCTVAPIAENELEIVVESR